MSKTPVSELNARMSLDIAPLEQAVPRAIGYLKRLGGAVQAEAFTAQNLGPDARALAENIRARVKNAPDMPQFGDAKEQQALADQIAAAQEESLRRRAVVERNFAQQHLNNIAEVKAAEAARVAEVAAAEERLAAAEAQRTKERLAAEQMLADRRAASARAQIEFADLQRDLISKSARESFALLDAEQRRREEVAANNAKIRMAAEQEAEREALRALEARQKREAEVAANNAKIRMAAEQEVMREVEQRLAAEQKIADIRRKQAQVRAASEFQRANPFEQQVLASKELNRLLAVRRGLQRGTVEFAEAELAVTRQIATVRSIRDELTAGTAAMRKLGNTAADSQKGAARFGLAMQQAGYQVQDFAVQVTSGTNGLVAFSQQASQLLGFFGGFKGAIAGAALAVGILAYRLYETKAGAEAAKKAQEEYNKTLKEYIALSRERAVLKDPLAKQGFAKQDAVAAIADFKKQKDAVAELEQKLIDARKEVFAPASGRFGDTPEAEAARVAVAQRVVEQLTSKTEAARNRLFELAKAASAARLELEKIDWEKVNAMHAQNLSDAQERAKSASSEMLSIDRERNQLANRNLTVFQKLAKAEEAIAAFGDPGSSPEAIAQQKRLILERDKLLAQAEDMAQGYQDSLDPLSEQKKKLTEINRLQEMNLLTAGEAALLQARIADERERQLKLPDVFRAQTGASFAGMRNTDGTANQLVTLQQQMLLEMRKLVDIARN